MLNLHEVSILTIIYFFVAFILGRLWGSRFLGGCLSSILGLFITIGIVGVIFTIPHFNVGVFNDFEYFDSFYLTSSTLFFIIFGFLLGLVIQRRRA